MPVRDFATKDLETEITEQEASWSLFEEFRTELSKLGEED